MLPLIPTHLDAFSRKEMNTYPLRRWLCTGTGQREYFSLSFTRLKTIAIQVLYSLSHKHYSFIMDEWMPIFNKRTQAFSLQSANKPYLETLEEILNDCDDHTYVHLEDSNEENADEGDAAEGAEKVDHVKTFMRIGHQSEGCLPQVDRVVGFCQGCPDASLDAIRSGNPILNLGLVALVDEQGRDGSREDSGALTPVDLYRRRCREVGWQKIF